MPVTVDRTLSHFNLIIVFEPKKMTCGAAGLQCNS